MKSFELAYAVGCVNEQYVLEAAESTEVEKRKSHVKYGVMAACVALVGLLAVSVAIAAGGFDALLSYYMGGGTENYLEEILCPAGSVSNNSVQLRMEGAIADRDSCYMVVSLIGLTEKEKRELENADVGRKLDIYGLSADGERQNRGQRSTGTYMKNSLFRKAQSMFPDASQTLVITYRPKECSMNDIQKVRLGFDDLVLELNVAEHMSPEYDLEPKSGNTSALTEVHMSRVGFSFMLPISDEMDAPEASEIRLIRADKTVLSDEEMHEIGVSTNYSIEPNVTETTVTGNWGRTPAIALINLDDYCGIQIGGENYYYAGTGEK